MLPMPPIQNWYPSYPWEEPNKEWSWCLGRSLGCVKQTPLILLPAISLVMVLPKALFQLKEKLLEFFALAKT
jgi:hypothetical protein